MVWGSLYQSILEEKLHEMGIDEDNFHKLINAKLESLIEQIKWSFNRQKNIGLRKAMVKNASGNHS